MTYAPTALPGDEPLKAAAAFLRRLEALRHGRWRVRKLGKSHVRVSVDLPVGEAVRLLPELSALVKSLSEDAAAREQALK